MANWVDRCEADWLDALFAAFLVTGLATLAMVQCRQPARRRIWGRCGLVGCLLVIPLVVAAPLPRFNLWHPTRSFWAVDAHRRPATVPRAEPDDPSIRASADDPAAGGGSAPGAGSPAAATLRRWTAIAYGVGLGLNLGRLGLGLVGTWFLIRGARPASARAIALLDSLPFALPERRRPRLLLAAKVGRPVLVGSLRPAILIPPSYDRVAAGPQLRLGLLHELAHTELGDARFGLIAGLAYSIWFPLPQVWWLQSQLRLDAEFLADHRAVGHFGTSHGYAESLVGLALPAAPGDDAPARRSRPADPPPRRSGGLASALFQRVQMLLKCPFRVEDRAPGAWTAAVALVSAVGVVAASCLSVRDRDETTLSPIGPTAAAPSRLFHLAELAIAPQPVADRPFDLRFRLPDQFRFACEILAKPAELSQVEILGYRLDPGDATSAHNPAFLTATWRRVEIVRAPDGFEAVQVDGRAVVAAHRPAHPAAWLTIRPIPGCTTRIRALRLTY